MLSSDGRFCEICSQGCGPYAGIFPYSLQYYQTLHKVHRETLSLPNIGKVGFRNILFSDMKVIYQVYLLKGDKYDWQRE